MAFAVSRWAAGVDFVEEILVETVVGVRPGIMVRDARLLLLLLLPTFEDVRADRLEAAGVCVLLEATSTVRFTGCERTTLLREELLETAGLFG